MCTNKYIYENMFHVADSFRVFVSKFWVFVFGILSYIISFKAVKCCNYNDQIDRNCYKKGSEVDEFGSKGKKVFEVDDGGDKVNRIEEETESSVMASSTSNYELLSGKNISGFIEEPTSLVFSVQELYMGSIDSNNFDKAKAEDSVHQEKTEDSVSVDKVLEKQEDETCTENELSVFTEFKFLPKYDFSNEFQLLSEDCSVDSEFDTIGCSSDGFSRSNDDFELYAYEFLAERNFSEGLGTEESESLEAISEEEGTESTFVQEAYDMKMRDVTLFDSDDDYIELKFESHSSTVLDKHDHEDLNEDEEDHVEGDLVYEASHLGHTSGKFEETSLEDKGFIPDDDDEFALEHDELIEQLKMEMKYARTGGLPTILEESDTPPKHVEELKPLKIDHKLEHKDQMKEIHQFYRSYLDKMRKLDILNSQTMHAIGLFQLKERGQSIKTQKSSVHTSNKSLIARNLWPCKPRRSEDNPAFKFIGDLHKDFELVYAGQLCLSWEILHWQYRKALELQEFDSQELRQYNQLADEFQLFQVLLQRFIENEPFQGCPRIQNYVNTRFAHCNFIQVPVIKDDSLKDKKGRKGEGEDAITSPMLTAIIEESMRVYWEFLRADKDENDVILKGPELQDSIDSELLVDTRTDYQKKEKRLKEILRSGSCIVKKLQKHHENRFNRALFFAQVELKLISRVLTMPKLTTDQLVWCHEKLAKINFCNRKLVLEPSFLLFPC